MAILGHIDRGQDFDFGRTAMDYARYRDIYPASMYEKLQQFGIVGAGMKILDVGTGSGVIPRNLCGIGANFCATDISEEQIRQAELLSGDGGIEYAVAPAEHSPFAPASFDLVIACQCFWYFDIPAFIAELRRELKNDGKFCRISMEWLPQESTIAAETEKIVLDFNLHWGGHGYQVKDYRLPDWSKEFFELETFHSYRENLPFSVDGWCGRMRSCRGVGATLATEQVSQFDRRLREYLLKDYSGGFSIAHHIQIELFRFKSQ